MIANYSLLYVTSLHINDTVTFRLA